MNKLYLLPISLILLSPGFADENVSEVTIISEAMEGRSEIALLSQNKEVKALEIDPKLVAELKEEISTIMKKDASLQEEVLDDQEIAYESPRTYKAPRARQALPVEEWAEEDEFQEESIDVPQHKAVRPRAAQSPRMQSERSAAVEQDSQQNYEQRQGSHVRRYPSHNGNRQQAQGQHARPQQARPQAPRVQEDTADLESEQPVQPRKAPARGPSAQHQRSQARPQAPRVQEDTADLQLEQPVQPRKAPARGPSAQQPRSQAKPNVHTQQKAAQGQRNAQQRTAPQQNARRNSAYDKNGAYLSPTNASGSDKSRIAQQQQKTNSSRSQMYSDDQMDQGQMNKQDTMMVNTSARPVVTHGWDVWIVGDVLLWQAVEENLTYAYTGNDTAGRSNRNLHTVHFDWDWGFRLGAGFNTPREGWDLDLYWTHIRNNAHGHVSQTTNNDVFQIWTAAALPLPGTTTRASADWHCHLDQVDFDLGREFYVGKHLTLRPYVGARSTWLFQDYDIKTSNANNIEQKADLKNRFWGFGFTAGLDTDWEFGWGVSMYGEADMAILLGFHDITQKGTRTELGRIWKQDKSFRVGRAILDLGMGLKWMGLFFDDRFGVTLKVGYEYHLYFDQNQYILTSGFSGFELFNPVNGNLIYQGVIGSIQFDF